MTPQDEKELREKLTDIIWSWQEPASTDRIIALLKFMGFERVHVPARVPCDASFSQARELVAYFLATTPGASDMDILRHVMAEAGELENPMDVALEIRVQRRGA